MNFYPHHISDFNNATRHLTRVERSVYREAIELYYDTENELTNDLDKLSRRLLCVSVEEKEALKAILSEFFTLTDTGYFHTRCDEEITKYRANTSAKAKAGIASALKRQQKRTDVEHVLNTRTTDEQLTNNQEPLTNNQVNTAQTSLLDNGFNEFWNAYPKKTGKDAAHKAWKKKKPKVDDVLKSLKWQIHSEQWQKGFIPNPATYLNEGRWQDEPTPERPAF